MFRKTRSVRRTKRASSYRRLALKPWTEKNTFSIDAACSGASLLYLFSVKRLFLDGTHAVSKHCTRRAGFCSISQRLPCCKVPSAMGSFLSCSKQNAKNSFEEFFRRRLTRLRIAIIFTPSRQASSPQCMTSRSCSCCCPSATLLITVLFRLSSSPVYDDI